MADTKISALPASTTPLAGTEVLPIVQGGATRQVSVDNLTSDRTILANGIQFPATQVSSADANTLDDYEEGTWTVNFLDAQTGGNASATTATGYYTKVGRSISVSFYVSNIDTTGLTAGNILYFTLPIASAATGPQRSAGAAIPRAITFPAGVTSVVATVGTSATRGTIEGIGSNFNSAGIVVSNYTSGGADLAVQLTYFN